MKSTRQDLVRRLVLFGAALATLVAIGVSPGCSKATLDNGRSSAQGSAAFVGCSAGTVECDGVCVSLDTDAFHCGVCGRTCGVDELCLGGTCSTYCAPGDLECSGVCLVAQSDPMNCGVCGKECSEGQFCDKGECSGECTGTVCQTSGANVCAHLEENNDHCGTCGAACGQGETCSSGVCVAACPQGRALCEGACVDVRSDASNCGVCGEICPAGVSCVEGVCGGGTDPGCVGEDCECAEGQTECAGVCVDTKASPFHCGACGKECALGEECVSGGCACIAGTEACGDICADTSSDNRNCGECGKLCTGGTSCESGSCECDSGLALCDDTCVDLDESLQHCGECSNDCATYESCVSGICKYDGDQCGGAARSIRIERVAFYQSVEQDLFDGDMVGTAARNVDVVQGLDAMIRVFVEPETGFTPRELSARVFLDNEGAISVFHAKKTVGGASVQSDLDSTFNIDIPSDALRGSTQYWVELVECGELPTTAVGSVVRVPSASETMASMDARETGSIRVVFVPIVHDGRTPDTSAATIEAYAVGVEKMYPTVDVETSVRAPVDSSQSGRVIDLGVTLEAISRLRTGDDVDSNVYYYGLIDPAATYREYCQRRCTTGLGYVPETGSFADRYRSAVGIGFGTQGVGTFAHELGHNHGRWHAPCGGPDDIDRDFPHAGGGTGAWGYDRIEQSLKDPSSSTDFMAYCENEWISDYSHSAISDRIATMNNVGGAAPDRQDGLVETTWDSILVTHVGPRWSTRQTGSGAPTSHPELGVVLDDTGRQVAEVDVHRIPISDGGGYVLLVPPAQPGWHAVGVTGGPFLAY